MCSNAFLNDTATSGGTRFEVLNFGVPGYNTVMECEMLRNRVAPVRSGCRGTRFSSSITMPLFRISFRGRENCSRCATPSRLRWHSSAPARHPRSSWSPVWPVWIPPTFHPSTGSFLAGPTPTRRWRRSGPSASDRKLPCLFDVDYWDAEPYRGPSPRAPDAGPAAEVSAKAVALGFIAANPLHEILAFLNRTGYHSPTRCALTPITGDAHLERHPACDSREKPFTKPLSKVVPFPTPTPASGRWSATLMHGIA